MNSPLKKISKILFYISLFFLIIFLAAYFYIKNYLSEADLKKYIISFSTNYLNRKIEIDKIDLNIFKGIVLNNVSISKIYNLSNSTSLFVKEINLRYDYKSLLKLKFNISKLIIYNLDINISSDILNSEINYYKNKFSSTNTNTTTKNSMFNINNIEIVNTKIKYNEVSFDINDITFHNTKLKKIENDINIFYDKYKIQTIGTIYLYKNISNLKQKINLNNHKILLSATSIDYTNISLYAKFKYKNKNFSIKINSSILSNILLNKYITISDTTGSTINLKNLKINLNNYYFSCNSYLQLHNIKNKPFLTSYPDLTANIDLSLNINGFLNNLYKSKISGAGKINDFSMSISTNFIKIKNSPVKIIKNKVILYLNYTKFNEIKISGNLSYKNIFKMFPVNANLSITSLPLSNITGGNIILNNINIVSAVDLKRELINFKHIKFKSINGLFSITDGIYHFNQFKKNNFSISANGVSVNEMSKILNITNLPLQGTLNTKSKIVFTISSNNNLKFITLKGSVNGNIIYNKIKNRLILNYEKLNNEIVIKNSSIITFKNKIFVTGKYNLYNNSVSISGNSPKFKLTSLPYSNLKGIINLNFNLLKSKNMNATINISSKYINFNNILFRNLISKLKIRNNILYGDIKINNFYSGKIINTITNNFKINRLNFISKGTKIDVAKLVKSHIKGDISGSLNYTTTLTKLNNDLKGVIKFNIVKGEIVNTEFQKGLGGFLNLLEGLEDIFYNNITGKIKLNNKNIEIPQINISCIDQKYLIEGSYNTSYKYLNLDIQPAFREDFVENIPNFALQIISRKNKWYYIKNIKIIYKNNKFFYEWKK